MNLKTALLIATLALSFIAAAPVSATTPDLPPPLTLPRSKLPDWLRRDGIVMAGSWEPIIYRLRLREGRFEATEEERARYEKEHSVETLHGLRDLGVNFLMTHYYKAFGLNAEGSGMRDAQSFAKLCHQQGMRVGAYIGGTLGVELLYKERPDAQSWELRDSQGKPIDYGGMPWRRMYNRNNPDLQKSYLWGIVKSAVNDMKADLIHLDNYNVGPAFDSVSVERFRAYLAKHGKPADFGLADFHTVLPPTAPSPDTALGRAWQDFACLSLAESFYDVASYARSLRKDVLMECNPCGVSTRTHPPVDHARLLQYGEAFWDEAVGPIYKNGKLTTRQSTYKAAQTMNNMVFAYVRNPIEAAEALAYNTDCLGCIAWFEWAKIASYPFSQEPVSEELRPYTSFFHEKRAYYRDAARVADLAVLRGFASQRYAPDASWQATSRCEDYCIEKRVPWAMIFDQHLADLGRFRAVCLVGCDALSEEQVRQIRRYAGRGGGIILTDETGKWDSDMRPRAADPFADLKGSRIVRVKADLSAPEFEAAARQACGGMSLVVNAPAGVTTELTEQAKLRRRFVHLVNYKLGDPARSIAVDVRVPKGWKTARVVLLRPDKPDTAPLSFTQTGDRVTFTVPETLHYALICVEAGGKPVSTMTVAKPNNDFPEPTPAMLHNYQKRIATAALSAQRERALSAKTPAEWEAQRKTLMAAYKRSLGPFPKKTPLDAVTVGRVELDYVTIEKVVFESRPKMYVTGNLYVPKPGREQKRPAVLLLSGHYPKGKSDPISAHQTLGLALAKKGIITFAIDPPGQGERVFYLDDKGQPETDCLTEHCYLGYACLLTGTNVMQYFLWDAIRAMDYLLDRPEIDPRRIAVTGISGGGTQTLALAPLETRASLIAPTCYVTSRLRWLGNAADAEQCWYGSISGGLDHSTLIEMAAPRPFQVQAAQKDFFPIEGTRESVADARKLFTMYGEPDRLSLVEDDCGHEYSLPLRKAFYAWLGKWYGEPADAEEPAVTLMEPEKLWCLPSGQVKTTYRDSRWIPDFNRERADAVTPKRALPRDRAGVEAYQRAVRNAMKTVLGPLPGSASAVKSMGTDSGATVTEKLWINTESGITVPAVISKPASGGRRLPAALLIEDTGQDEFAEARAAVRERVMGLRQTLAAQGFLAMTVEVRGYGASSPAAAAPGPLNWIVVGGEAILTQDGFMCGVSLFGGRVYDALQCLSYLRTRPDVDTGRIAAAGWGQGGLIVLSAAALDTKLAACAVIGSLASYRTIVDADKFAHPPSSFVWDVLSHYDLPEVAACVAPRPLLIASPVDAMKQPMPGKRCADIYKATSAVYDAAAQPDRLRVGADIPDLQAWLREALAR